MSDPVPTKEPPDTTSPPAQTASSEKPASSPYKLRLHVQISFHPRVCDLSGAVPFHVRAGIGRRRGGVEERHKHDMPVVVRSRDTILDLPDALARNLLRIVPMRSRTAVEEGAAPIAITASPAATASPEFMALGPGTEISWHRPQVVSYALDVAKLPGLEDGRYYRIEVTPSESGERAMAFDVDWWRFGSLPVESSQAGEAVAPRVQCKPFKVVFKARRQVPVPPRFEYHIETHPSTISLSRPAQLTVSVQATLQEDTVHTVYTSRLGGQPLMTALHDRTTFKAFEVVDLDTHEILSAEGIDIPGTMAGQPYGVPNLHRSHFREFLPRHTYSTARSWGAGGGEEGDVFCRSALRIAGPQGLLGRRLGVMLRRTEAWCAPKSMDELFQGADKVLLDIYTAPLVIESAAYAEISVVA